MSLTRGPRDQGDNPLATMVGRGGERVRLEGLTPDVYEHPLDRAALQALRRTPALPALLKFIFGGVSERSLRLLYLANSVRVGPDQFSGLYKRHLECCEILDIEEPPELFVSQTPLVNAGAVGMDSPFIVLNSGTLDLLNDEELDFVIGHELGHILSGHVLYKTLLNTALSMTLPLFARVGLPIAGIAVQGLIYALLEWDRKSELSGDRAGLLCVQSTDAAFRTLMKMAGGSNTSEMSVDAFIRQAEDYHEDEGFRDSALKFLNLIGRTHPFPVLRLMELRTWIESGAYDQILAGDYPLQNSEDLEEPELSTEESLGESDQDVHAGSPDAWGDFLRSVGETVTETGQAIKRQVQSLMDQPTASGDADATGEPSDSDDAEPQG